MSDIQIFQVAASGASEPNILLQFLPFIAVLGVLYFLMIRPQQKRAKARKEMLDALKRGDTVVTAGGIIGKVAKVQDDEILLDAGENVRVRVVRSMVADRRSSASGEPIAAPSARSS